MTTGSRLDGAVPIGSESRQDIALTALTRRVAELEHRLDVMKIIVGLVPAGKIIIVVLLVYVLFGNGFPVRSRGSILQTSAITRGIGS